MSFKNRKFSLDSSFATDGDRVLGIRKGSSRFGSKKSKQSLDEARLDSQELNHDVNTSVSQRKQVVAEENPERSDEHANNQSSLKLNKSFHKLFPDIPEGENLIQNFTFALQKEILYHGKLFVSESHVCFHSAVLLKDTKVMIPVSCIKEVKKHNAALSMLTIRTASDKYSFVSLRNRDLCYKLLQRVCSHAQQRKSPHSSPHVSPAENEGSDYVVFSSSSVEDSTDHDLSKHNDICLDNGFAHVSAEGPARYTSSLTDYSRAASWIPRVTVTPFFLLRDFERMNIFHIYMMLMALLLLVSVYVGLRIMALEEQLNSLGALTELSLHYRDYQET